MLEMIVISVAVAAASITITRSKITAGVREKASGRLRELLKCPYCVSHWLAAAILPFARVVPCTLNPVPNAVIWWLAVVGMSAIVTGLIFRLLLWQEEYIGRLEDDLEKTKTMLGEFVK